MEQTRYVKTKRCGDRRIEHVLLAGRHVSAQHSCTRVYAHYTHHLISDLLTFSSTNFPPAAPRHAPTTTALEYCICTYGGASGFSERRAVVIAAREPNH
jgi:hypothetical protein